MIEHLAKCFIQTNKKQHFSTLTEIFIVTKLLPATIRTLLTDVSMKKNPTKGVHRLGMPYRSNFPIF